MEVSMMGTRWELWELSMHPMIKAVLYLLVNVSDPVNFRSATHVNCLSFSQISVPSLSTFPPWHGFMNHFPGRYSCSLSGYIIISPSSSVPRTHGQISQGRPV